MSIVQKLEEAVRGLSPADLAEFRAWFEEFDWARWDRQIERDSREGKLEALAEKALAEHKAAKTSPL